MQGPRKHDQYSLHLVSWKIWDIRQKPVWLQETSQHHRPADGLERYLCDTFAQRQQAVGLFFDLEKACETTWQYGIIPDLYRIGLRGRPIFVSEYLRDRRIRVRIGTTLSDEFYLEEGVPTGGVLAVTCLGLKNNELPSYIARDVFRALFVDGSLFPWALPGHHRKTFTAGSKCHTGMGDKEWFQCCGPQVQSRAFHCTPIPGSEAPHCEDWKHTSVSGGVNKVPRAVVGLAPLIQEAHQRAKDKTQGGSQPHSSGCSFEVCVRSGCGWWVEGGGGGWRQRHTFDAVPGHRLLQTGLRLHCVWLSIKRQLDSIHNSGLSLALGAFCTSPVSSLYTEANEAPLEECRLKLSLHYYLKTRAFIDNPAHHALHKFDRTTGDLYAPRPNGRGDMTRPPAPPIGLKVEEAMTSAEINAELVCPLRTTNFPPGTHGYDPKRHDLIEGVNKCKISRQEAQAKFNEYCEAQGSHDEVYTDGSKMNERVGAATIINRYFQNGETTCRQLSKRLTDNSTIFVAEATAISLALNHYRLIVPVHHNVVVYSDSISCLQAIEDEDTENPFICHIMNLLWVLSNRGTCVCFCWIPSHCGIEGNERMDQLAKETLDQDIDPLASVHYTDLKPLVNSYIQQLVQTKWDVAVHGQDLYLVKPTLGQPKKIQHLTRAEEVVITRLLSPIFCPEDHRLLVTTVVKHWALTICSWGVQCYRNVVTNTTQLTHWMPSLRQFPRLA